MIRLALSFSLFFGALAISPHAQANDKPGSSDHLMISRYEGSKIVEYKQDTFNEFTLPLGPVKKKPNYEQSETLRGKLTRLTYETPKGRSVLEVYTNYEQALQKAGFITLFQCADKACGGRDFNLTVGDYRFHGDQPDGQRYLSTKLSRPDGDVYVSLYVTTAYNIGGARKDNVYTQLHVLEAEAMEMGKVMVDANAMFKGIVDSGRIALYGIYFDTDKATIKPESKPTLDEIAALMKSQPALKLIVVGHTDSAGDYQHNLNLSKQRAQAVMQALIKHYSIAGNRLKAEGVAYLAPAASNRSDKGRSLNRRVELIEQ